MAQSDEVLRIDSVESPEWAGAFERLLVGQLSVVVDGLLLSCDPPAGSIGRRLQVEFACPVSPIGLDARAREQFSELGVRELERARDALTRLGTADTGFALLVEQSDVVFVYVHRFDRGSQLVGVARPTGPMTWK